MIRRTSWSGRVLAITAVFVAAGLCVLLGSAGSVAARTVTGPTDGLSVTTIQAGRPVDVEIRLPRPNPFDDPLTGSLARPPLAGTHFTARRLEGVDLTTSGGWAAARALTIAAAERGPFGHSVSAVTDDAGVARLRGLPIGLYLVTSATPGFGHRSGYAPFLITLPTGGEAGWNHAPVVYAKPTYGGPGIVLPPFPFPIPWPGSSDEGPVTGSPPGGSAGSGSPGSPVVPDSPGESGSPDRESPGGPGSPNREPGTSRPGGGAPTAGDAKSGMARGPLALTGTPLGLIAGAGAVLVGFGLVLRHVSRDTSGRRGNDQLPGSDDGV